MKNKPQVTDNFNLQKDIIDNFESIETQLNLNALEFDIKADYKDSNGNYVDQTDKIQSFINYCMDNNKVAFFPKGTYAFTSIYIKNRGSQNTGITTPIILGTEKGNGDLFRNDGTTFKPLSNNFMFYVNLDETGKSTCDDANKYMTFTIKNIKFDGRNYTSMNCIKMHRVRAYIENIVVQEPNNFVIQDLQDSQGWSNYCDFSIYRNIRTVGLKGQALKMYYADATEINGLYLEQSKSTASVHTIEIRNSGNVKLSNIVINGTATDTTAPTGTSGLTVVSSSVTITNLYSEQAKTFEKLLNISSDSTVTIDNFEARYTTNDLVRLFKAKLTINNMKLWSITNAGCYDFNFLGDSTTQSQLTILNYTAWTYTDINTTGVTRWLKFNGLANSERLSVKEKPIWIKADGSYVLHAYDKNGNMRSDITVSVGGSGNMYFNDSSFLLGKDFSIVKMFDGTRYPYDVIYDGNGQFRFVDMVTGTYQLITSTANQKINFMIVFN